MKKEKETKEASSMPSQSVRYVKIPSTLLLTKQNKKTLEEILNVIEEITGVEPKLYMATKTRETSHVTLRQITAYCLRLYTNISLKDIGLIQGMRDHSTIIHSIKAVTSWMEGAPGFTYEKKLVEEIIERHEQRNS